MKKLRILQVGYGWPPEQGGGGVIYTKSLSEELSSRGHEVFYFFSGRQNLLPFSYLRSRKEGGVNLIEYVNSPNFYKTQFNSCQSELENKLIENAFGKILNQVRPDVIHIQNFPGLTPSIIEVAKRLHFPVVVSLHNYIPLCPVGEMFDYEKSEICSFKNCDACYTNPNKLQRLKNKIIMTMVFMPEALKRKFRSKINVASIQRNSSNNIIPGAKTRRLTYFKKMLDNADLLIAVSGRVKKIYEEYLKVNPQKLVVNHIGTRAAEFIKPLVFKKITYPIKLIFTGSLEPHKGFQNLLEAFKKLDQKRAKLLIYAPINEAYRDKVDALQKNYNLEFRGGYKYSALNEILKEAQVGVVPPICHDNAPQVVFELFAAGLPIVSSDVGGMSDFVFDKTNGLIFKHNDPNDLFKKLKYLIENPTKIIDYQKNIKPMITITNHISEMERIYRDLKNVNNK